MKYIIILLSILGTQLNAQNKVDSRFEKEIWVCFNCKENDSTVIGKDTLNLLPYSFASYVSNLNFHAEILPKLLFKSNGDIQFGNTVNEDSLVVISGNNWKWNYSNNDKSKVIIKSNRTGATFEYNLLYTDNRFRLIRNTKSKF